MSAVAATGSPPAQSEQPKPRLHVVESDPNLIRVLDEHGFLALDGVLASDLAVVNAARVSFNQSSQTLSDRDAGLIRFLMRERHGSPFEHGYFRFVVKAPLFVVREHHRHRAGHSYNEWSGRYSKLEAEFYRPEYVRKQVGKPGQYFYVAADEQLTLFAQDAMSASVEQAFATYESLLEEGVAKEVARMVLPLATYTKYYWSCNPRSLMHFCSLRNDEAAQYEIRCFAAAAEHFLASHMPRTYEAFVASGRVAP